MQSNLPSRAEGCPRLLGRCGHLCHGALVYEIIDSNPIASALTYSGISAFQAAAAKAGAMIAMISAAFRFLIC
jgi:hypothetical protein